MYATHLKEACNVVKQVCVSSIGVDERKQSNNQHWQRQRKSLHSHRLRSGSASCPTREHSKKSYQSISVNQGNFDHCEHHNMNFLRQQIMNYLINNREWGLRPRPCRIDLVIARSIRKCQSLRVFLLRPNVGG